MQIVAIKLTRWNPNLPHWFILAAYATRRAESLEKAGKILIEGEQRHPKDGTIQFNLACYESQMGNLEKAKVHLKKATAAEPQFKQIALEDLDLEPLWDSPIAPGQGVIFDAIIPAPGKYPIVDHSMRDMTIGAAGLLSITP